MCVYITFSLSIHLLMDIKILSMSWLLWIMLQWTWEYINLFETLIWFPLDVNPELGLLAHTVLLLLIFWRTSTLFSTVELVHQFTFPSTVYKSSLFCTFSPTLIICCLFDNSHFQMFEVISHSGFVLTAVRTCWRVFNRGKIYAF